MKTSIESKFVTVENTRIHYLTAGSGEPILFIHGFPTSSYLWRNVMNGLSENYHVIAIDLPGYGKSDKKLEDSFSFRYYNRILSSFVKALDIEQITLGVHDLGGPVGLYWMIHNVEKVKRLLLFNTLVYPEFSLAVKLFGLASITPGMKQLLTSQWGIKKTMKFGVYKKDILTDEDIKHYQAAFVEKSTRKVLLKSIRRLSLKGFKEIETKLHLYQGPIQIIYGENDKILPKVSYTMSKLKENLPQAKINAIPNCGHFLQEDEPDLICELVYEFMKSTS